MHRPRPSFDPLTTTSVDARRELAPRATHTSESEKLDVMRYAVVSAQLRNASFWSIKTPGVILDEMRAAKSEIEALGRDISGFRDAFEAQLVSASQQFEKKFHRKPGVGRAARDDDDQVVRSSMQPVPTDADWQHKSYKGEFVAQWSAFEREFGDFWAAHADSWTDRMWRATYDQAVEFRQRALTWRETFIKAGGHPTTPAPQPPVEEILPGVASSWKKIALVGGVSLGALFLIPALFRSATTTR